MCQSREVAEREYQTRQVRVGWNSDLCIHTGRCIRRAPGAFDSGRRPWIQLEGTDPADIEDAVRLCPTGALTFERIDGVAEQADEEVVVELRPNGPYFVRGPVRVVTPAGEVVHDGTRVALCRCGNTKHAPFCDNTHREIGFRDPPLRRVDDGPEAPA
jgi:uncharacterized Fe-S cluster protein YjdI/CDGSH-type Zn-finger protein